MTEILQREAEQNANEKTEHRDALAQGGEEGEEREVAHAEWSGEGFLLRLDLIFGRLITMNLSGCQGAGRKTGKEIKPVTLTGTLAIHEHTDKPTS